MNFYRTWNETISLNVDDTAFLSSFLDSSVPSLDILHNGSDEDISYFFDVMVKVTHLRMVDYIASANLDDSLNASVIPCFSTFDNGAVRLNELLEFAPSGLTYAEIGYQLTSTPNQLAQIKYGENHAKLAEKMSLVLIKSVPRPAMVTTTALGHYLTKFKIEDKFIFLQKLLLRDRCVQKIVHDAANGTAKYREIVETLSSSTAYRRRTSVKSVVEFALNCDETRALLEKIDWEM